MIIVYDLGGQYCHMISRRYDDKGISCRIVEADTPASQLDDCQGIILSGGPQSVYGDNSPTVDPAILDLGVPILAICYGHQLLGKMLGGAVEQSHPEYGQTSAIFKDRSALFAGLPAGGVVWMSHGDAVTDLPEGCSITAETKGCSIAAFSDMQRNFHAVQFHPEVEHTEWGDTMLENFGAMCGIKPTHQTDRIGKLLQQIRDHVRDRKVFFFVSGGVDSTVAFALCALALKPDQLLGIYVDTGLMRLNETAELMKMFSELGFYDRLLVQYEADRFLPALEGVYDPEEKREIIGRLFMEVQQDVMALEGLTDGWMLGQGTIYPDVIESGKGSSAKIKTHHNQCPEVKALIDAGLVIEPLRNFYKDQVRQIGRELGLADRFVNRWPFPGPGLAIRCLCAQHGLNAPTFVPLEHDGYEIHRLPLRSVGVQGDARSYRNTIAVRGSLAREDLVELARTFHQDRVIALVAGSDEALRTGWIKPATITPQRITFLQLADNVVRRQMEEWQLTETVWQFPVVLLPFSFTGGESIVLRPVNSTDGMTANFHSLPEHVLQQIADQILLIIGIDAVFLDASDKPPATIEWE